MIDGASLTEAANGKSQDGARMVAVRVDAQPAESFDVAGVNTAPYRFVRHGTLCNVLKSVVRRRAG